ncbi:MAG: hypothetical protein ACJ71T_10995 [Actinomycetales bacterium]
MFRGFLSGLPTRSAVLVFALSAVLGLGLAVVAPTTVAPAAAATQPTALVDGTVGDAYLNSVPITQPFGLPVTFSVASGQLPPGLDLHPNAAFVSGVPTAAGTWVFSLKVTKGVETFISDPFSITIEKGKQVITFTSAKPSNPVAGDSYQATAKSGSKLPVTFSAGAASDAGACTVSATGLVRFTGVGQCVIAANQGGDDDWEAAPASSQSMTVGQGAQAITITSTPPASPKVDETYQVVATGGGSGQPVTFTVDSTSTRGACSVNGSGVVRFSAVGSCVIDADQAGDSNYTAAPRVTQTLLIGKGGQTIAFTSRPSTNMLVGDGYQPTATGGGSGHPVTFATDATSDAGACLIDAAGLVHLTGMGTCVIGADQTGDATYSAAPHVTQAFAVSKRPQSISFTSLPPVSVVVGDTYQVSATGGGSGNDVTFAVDSLTSGCTVSPTGLVTFTAAGSCRIDANQAGNATYSAAAQVSQTVTVGRAPQSLTFTTTLPAHPVVDDTFQLSATGGASGQPVTFSLDPGARFGICVVDPSGLVHFIGTGPCIVDADQAGDANYLPAAPISQSTTVGKAPQTITISSMPPADPIVGGTYQIVARGGPDMEPVLFSIDPTSSAGACTVNHWTGLVTFTGPGTCVVDLDQEGDGGYLPAHTSLSLTVAAVPTPTPGSTPTPRPSGTPAPGAVDPPVQGAQATNALPFTGTTAVPLLSLAIALLLAGSVLLGAARGANRGRHR